MAIKDLVALYDYPVDIVVHEKRSSYLKIEKRWGRMIIHLHRLFEEAPSPVLEAIVSYTKRKDSRALAVIRQMAHLYFSSHTIAPIPLQSTGVVYDLSAIYEKNKELYFTPEYSASIGWSDRTRASRFRSITFGTYNRHLNQIRIHPLLDANDVPSYFVEFIVYHEMLHAVCPVEMDRSGRVRIHTKLFRQKEKEFAQFQEAKEWEKKSLLIFKKRVLHGRT